MKNVIDLLNRELTRLRCNYKLAGSVNWNVSPTKEDMTNDIIALNEAIEILSNERGALGKHECKEKDCKHPRSERMYIGQNTLKCCICGKEFQ